MNKGRRWVIVVLAVVLSLMGSIAAAQAAAGTEWATVDGNSASAALKQTPASVPGIASAPGVPLSCTKQLVVLLDASDSISTAEWNAQLDGLSDAILDPDSVRRDGSIQLTVIKYYTVNAGSIYQTRTLVEAGLDHVFITDGNAVTVANAIQSIGKPPSPPWIKNWTPLASAIDAATVQLTGEHIVDGAERIINISHDGNTNINRAGNAWVGETLARPDVEAARAAAIAAGIDEITIEGLGDIDDPGEDDPEWLRDNIAYPQPGHDAPASWEPGWIYLVGLDAGKFKEAISHKVDNEPPVITCPADITVECDEPTDPWYTGNATAIDDCDPDPIITYSDVETPGECEGETIITRTWTATDSIGNSATCVQTITVVDTTPPEITVPGNVTIECDESTDPSNTGNANATDICDPEPVITWDDVETPGRCEQETIITRTWTATDDCGNFAEGNQTITVVDTTSPVITVPPDVTIECDESTDPWYTGNATAIDNCDPDPDIIWTHVENPGQCEGETIITRTWTAIDDCGNVAEGNQTITVVDTTPPVITVPDDVTVECDESTDPWYTGNATAVDNCDPEPVITYSDVEAPGRCANETIITRTWTATDDCDNAANSTQTITVVDTTPPVVTVPGDVTIECDESTDPSNTGGNATAIDNCDPEPAITWSDVEAPGRCEQETIITRTWTATDDCGNAANSTQTITVVDTTPPVITAPPPVTIGCDEQNHAGNATAIDNCDPEPIITHSDSPPSDGVIIRTWTATDDCGNAANATQRITIGNDTTPPVITCPPDVTVECDESTDPWYTGNATATDFCDDDPEITYSDVVTPGECEHEWTITRTWWAEDESGNRANCTQTITVVDTTPPEITVPADVEIDCDESQDPSNTGNATATDNCDDDPIISYSDAWNGECPGIITRTWTATDDCGNTASGTQIITIGDTTPPVIIAPDPVTIRGNESTDPSNTGFANATDNCDTDLTITWDDKVHALEVPPIATQIVVLLDGSNSMSSAEWGTQIDGLSNAIMDPDCVPRDGSVQLTVIKYYTVQQGSTYLTRTLVEAGLDHVFITDGNAGDVANAIQNIAKPVNPPHLENWTPLASAIDAATAQLTGDNTIEGARRIINISHDGNTNINRAGDSWVDETIARADAEAARAAAIAAGVDVISVEGVGDIAEGGEDDPEWLRNSIVYPQPGTIAPPFTQGWVYLVGTDAGKFKDAICQKLADGGGGKKELCEVLVERLWTATDDCGNSANATQIITIEISAPVITCPPDTTVECDESTDPSNTGYATATDVSDPDLEITYSDSISNGVITRTWTATNDCGISAECTQIITIVGDNTPPEITIPADVAIECDESTDPSNTGNATATDSCDDDPTVSYSDAWNGECPGIITRTWTATDDSGNTANGTQIITVGDTTPPEIICPVDVLLEPGESTAPFNTGNATATDNCDPDPLITHADEVTHVDAPPATTQLVVLLDASDSINSAEWNTQIDGLSNAILDPNCVPHDGSAQLTVIKYYTVQYGSTYQTRTFVEAGLDHVFITDINAVDVANTIQNIGKPPSPPWIRIWTPLAAAIDAATAQLTGDNAIEGARRVINISHDGNTNINRTGNAYVGETLARADVEAARAAAIAAEIDEISVEGLGDIAAVGEDDPEWLRDSIVYPQPGTIAPPFTSGWVYLVGTDAGKFEDAICNKFPSGGLRELIIRTWTATDDCGNTASCEQVIRRPLLP